MEEKYLFDDEIKEKFYNIDSKFHIIKHALETIIRIIESEGELEFGYISILMVINAFFEKTKEDYNNLEEELGVLV